MTSVVFSSVAKVRSIPAEIAHVASSSLPMLRWGTVESFAKTTAIPSLVDYVELLHVEYHG